MPTVSETTQILDFISENPEDQRSYVAMQKLGIQPQAVEAWRAAKAEPNNPKSVVVKNKIFDTISSALPAKQEINDTVGFVDRFAVKNLIDRDPDLQQKYFEKKGYKTRLKDGELEIRKPDEIEFTAVDPKGIDRFDIFDIFGDALEAVATGFATGSKVIGAIGAPATGGASLAAGVGLGAAATGAFETGKQALAKGLGLRDDFDFGRIAQSAAIGGAATAVGKGVEKVIGKIAGHFKSTPLKVAKEAEQIAEAAKRIGIKPALRQHYDDLAITRLEESFEKIPTIIGRGIRKSAEKRKEVYDDAVEQLVSKYSAADPIELGAKAKSMLVESINNEMSPIKKIYEKLSIYLKGQDEFVDATDALESISKSIDDFHYDDVTTSTMGKWFDKVSNIKNIDDISKVRTIVGKDAKIASRNGEYVLANSLNDLYGSLTRSRSKSLEATIKNASTTMGSDKAEMALVALKQADTKYAAVAEKVRNLFTDRKISKQGIQSIVDHFDDFVKDNDVVKKILDVNDPKKLEYVRTLYPDVFDVLAEGYVAKVAQQSKSGLSGSTKLSTFLNRIVALPKKTQQIILGDNYLQKVADLQVLNRNMPASVNPSGTAWTNTMLKSLTEELGALKRYGALQMQIRRGGAANIINKIAATAGSAKGVGVAEFGMRQSFQTPAQSKEEQRQKRQFDLPNNAFKLPNGAQ